MATTQIQENASLFLVLPDFIHRQRLSWGWRCLIQGKDSIMDCWRRMKTRSLKRWPGKC